MSLGQDLPEGAKNLTTDQIDFLLKVINRFDFYLNSTNTKASLILAWNGIVIGTILLKFNDILSNFPPQHWVVSIATILVLLVGLCSLISNVLVFIVVSPFLKETSKISTGKVLTNDSMLFFGSVAPMGAKAYYARIVGCSSEELLTDLADQAAILAQGLEHKMQLIRYSIVAIGCGLVLISGLIILKAFDT